MGGLSPAAVLVDEDGNPVEVTLDGSVYKIEVLAKSRKADGTVVNPATEDTLSLIKNTDGVKKITDPLPAGDNNIGNVDIASSIPAGTNEIGKAAQGTKAAPENAWPLYVVDASGNAVGIVLDGAIRRFQTQAKLVRTSDGAYINPATEDTLALIKTTDGIKKIVDPLAAGTNEIGKVAQGTRAAAAAGWPVYAVDADGHAVGVILDGALYRFAVDAKIGKGASDLVHLDSIDTATGRGRLKVTLYTQDGDPIAFGSVPPTPEELYNKFCLNAGSESLLVNGSSTPVVFTYPAHATEDISLQEIKFVMAANGITFGTNYFGGISGPLTNGLLVEITAGGHTGTVYNLKQNESFVNFASPGGFEWVVSSKDLMASTYSIGGGFKLKAGTSDCVKVTVRDNLSSAGTYFKCFVKGHLLPAS